VALIRKQNGRIGQAEYDKILSAFRQRIVQQPKRHR